MLFVTTDATHDARHWTFRCAAIACSVETPVWPSTRLLKVRTRTEPEDNHASVLPDENGPKYAGGPDGASWVLSAGDQDFQRARAVHALDPV